jgi:taurine dioxygenase
VLHRQDEENYVPHVNVVPIEGSFAAEIRCGDLRQIDDDMVREIRSAWLRHGVVLFRDQRLEDADLIAFGRRFGEFQYSKPLVSPAAIEGKVRQGGRIDRYPEITVVSNVVENGVAIGGLGDGEVSWHTDMNSFETPPNQTILYALEAPPSGGRTGFANMTLAYAALPQALKQRIDPLTLKHDPGATVIGYVRPGHEQHAGDELPVAPGTVHPLVRTHPENGMDSLYLGRRPRAYLVGLPVNESEALLDQLWQHATQPQFIWHHEWRVGDMLMWDNRCVMHRREPFDETARRVMHRMVIKGTKPFRERAAA